MAWTDDKMKIAEWMLEEFNEKQRLAQKTASRVIRQNFGEQYVYKNKRQNWAINKGVLDAFNKLTPEGVVWSRGAQVWRTRRPNAPQDSRMVR